MRHEQQFRDFYNRIQELISDMENYRDDILFQEWQGIPAGRAYDLISEENTLQRNAIDETVDSLEAAAEQIRDLFREYSVEFE